MNHQPWCLQTTADYLLSLLRHGRPSSSFKVRLNEHTSFVGAKLSSQDKLQRHNNSYRSTVKYKAEGFGVNSGTETKVLQMNICNSTSVIHFMKCKLTEQEKVPHRGKESSRLIKM